MTIANISGANKAYQAAKNIPTDPYGHIDFKPEFKSFENMVKETAVSTIQTIRAGDQAAVAGLRGEMGTQQVVEATMAMETAFQVTVAVRDKVVEAYQEIMRMAV